MPPTQRDYQNFYDQIAALREELIDRRSSDLTRDPALADAISKLIEGMEATIANAEAASQPTGDTGFAQLIGIGADAATELGATRVPQRVDAYDEAVTPERLVAVGDLYYIYQHERLGVFRVMRKLKELFEAGTLRLSTGQGAFRLYQFDKREVLRYTERDRHAAYRRVLGYGRSNVPAGATPNNEFHHLFVNFVDEVARFWRDKRVSDVIRERADDPSFGSIAAVRRSGLDLRNNLKWASYGHVNVLRVEVMQLLDESFRILSTDDVKQQFGAENAWDVIEEVLTRYFNEQPATSPRQRMATSGRDILRWLAQGFILRSTRGEFEALLRSIADPAEEWITSAETVGVARRRRTAATGERRTPRSVRRPPASDPLFAGGRDSEASYEAEFEA